MCFTENYLNSINNSENTIIHFLFISFLFSFRIFREVLSNICIVPLEIFHWWKFPFAFGLSKWPNWRVWIWLIEIWYRSSFSIWLKSYQGFFGWREMAQLLPDNLIIVLNPRETPILTRCLVAWASPLVILSIARPVFITKTSSCGAIGIHFPSDGLWTSRPPTLSWYKRVIKPESKCSTQLKRFLRQIKIGHLFENQP